MRSPTSQAEQDVEEMLQSFRDSFAKSRSDAGGAPPPPPPPKEPVASSSGSSSGGGSKWGALKKEAEKDAKAPETAKAPPAFKPPPIPATPRPYVAPPGSPPPSKPPAPPPVPAAKSPGGKASKWGSLKEGVEPKNAIERAAAEKKAKAAEKADEIDIVKPTGGGDSFTARIKAAQAAKAGSR